MPSVLIKPAQQKTACSSLGDFLITYDNAEEGKENVGDLGLKMRFIPMPSTHGATMKELVIAKDLQLMDRFTMFQEAEAKYVARKIKTNRPDKGVERIL